MSWVVHVLMFIAPSVVFAWIYVSAFDRTIVGMGLHLSIVFGFVFLGLTGHATLSGGESKHVSRMLAGFWALAWVCFVAFYLGCLLSLASWGRIPDSTLILSYSGSVGPLLQSQGLNPLVFIAVLVFLFFSLFCAAFWVFRRAHWARQNLMPLSRGTYGVLSIAFGAIIGLKLYPYFSGMGQTVDEPFQIVFGKNLRGFRNIDIDESHFAEVSAREQSVRQALRTRNASGQPNVVLIIVEGMRPDHLSAFGYSRETTPELSSFSERAEDVSVHQAWSVCGESFCGILGLLASRYFHDLPASPITLTEVLMRSGYNVHYVLSGDHSNFFALRELYGPMTSFHDGSTVGAYGGQVDRNDDRHMIDALARLDFDYDRPIGVVIHVMGGHLLANRFRAPKWVPEQRYGLSGSTASGDRKVRSQEVVNFYDNGLLQADQIIGHALEILERRAVLDSALVLVTSDHGESLGEHGVFGHAKVAYDHALRVPMIAMKFGSDFRVNWNERTLVSLIDAAPSVLCELGLSIPEVFQGVPLQSNDENLHIRFSQGLVKGWIRIEEDGALKKFWWGPGGRNPRLFLLESDPHEEVNLAEGLTESEVQALISATEYPPSGGCPE